MLRAAFTSALHGPALQATHWKTAWLLRFSGAMCPHWEHRCDVYAAGTNSRRPEALYLSRATKSPQPWRLIWRLRPRFCATLVPGCSRVPRAGRVMARTFKSSTRTVSKRRARSVVVVSTQSRRRSVSRARTFATPSFVRARRADPRCARARRCNRRNRSCFPGAKARSMQQLPVGQGNRDRYAAVNTHDAAITGPQGRVRDGGKGDVPAPRAIQSDSIGLHGVGDGARPAELDPPDLGYPDLPMAAVEPFDVARFDSDLAESFMPTGLAPRRGAVSTVKVDSHPLGEVPQRLLLHGLRPGRQPVVFGAGLRQLGTLLVVPGRFSAWLPVLLLLDGKIPHKPRMATVLGHDRSLLTTGKQPKSAHTDNLGTTTDNQSKGGKRRFLPRLKPGVSTPPSR